MAVLDLGLGSFHLGLFESGEAATSLVCRRSWSETVRLADGVADYRMRGASFARGLAAASRLLRDLEAFDRTCPVFAFATAALSESDRGPALCDEIGRRHGRAVELLSGEAEARFCYLGARSHLAPAGRLAVADLGGQLLEAASGAGGDCDLLFSVPLGVLTLRDVYLRPERALDRAGPCGGPAGRVHAPSLGGLRGARERVAATVRRTNGTPSGTKRFGAAEAARAIWDRRPECLVLTSGTARALGVLADELGLRRPGADEIGLAALARLVDVLSQFRPVEIPALGVEESRSDAIAVGAVVLHTLMELLGFASAAISPRGRREGAALESLGRLAHVSAADRFHTAVT